MNRKLNRILSKQTVRVGVVFVASLVGSGILVYVLLWGFSSTKPEARVTQSPPTVSETTGATQRERGGNAESIISSIFEQPEAVAANPSEGWGAVVARITMRLLLAALLGAALAFRPRKQLPALRRNPYVAQTQILLAIVASALMMIVGDNAARAFGIFAAVSLVRFRTNIRDPKEISVLLISLGIGLATGVGRPELAVVFCAFALIALWVLERSESRQVFRAMELTVATRNIEATQRAVTEVLERHDFAFELRALTRNGEDRDGTIVDSVDVSPLISTDKISGEILARDRENITSIGWEQKKNFSYVYQ